jgi:hypothetical protein
MVVVDEHADGASEAGVGPGDAPQNSGPSVPPTLPTGLADIVAQLAQARELKAKLTEKPRIFIENPNPCTIAIVPGSVAIAYRTSHR